MSDHNVQEQNNELRGTLSHIHDEAEAQLAKVCRPPVIEMPQPEYTSGFNSVEEVERYPMFKVGKSLMALFKEAAADSTLTDREVRNIVRYLSADPIDEADVQRTHELAKRFGWETTE